MGGRGSVGICVMIEMNFVVFISRCSGCLVLGVGAVTGCAVIRQLFLRLPWALEIRCGWDIYMRLSALKQLARLRRAIQAGPSGTSNQVAGQAVSHLLQSCGAVSPRRGHECFEGESAICSTHVTNDREDRVEHLFRIPTNLHIHIHP